MRIPKTIIFIASILLLAACGDQDSTSGFAFLLTDAPGDFEQVPLQIKAIEAYRVGGDVAEGEKAQYMKGDGTAAQLQSQVSEAAKKGGEVDGGEWIRMQVKESVQQQDLLKLQDGKTAELGDEEVPAGYYNRIRLMVATAKVVVDGETHELGVASEGIELQFKFQLKGGEDHEMTVDFDAKQSIKMKADGSGYDLAPVVNVQQFRYRVRTCDGEGDCQPDESAGEGDGECKDGACVSGEPSPDNKQP